MAVLTHLVGGVNYVGASSLAITTEYIVGSTFTALTQSGTATGVYAQSVTGAGAVNMNVAGTYTVTYTATDDGLLPHTVTQTVSVEKATGDFLNGSELRDGRDVTGSVYEGLVRDGEAPETASAYFDEQALDPYEVANTIR